LNFDSEKHRLPVSGIVEKGRKILDSSEKKWGGPGAMPPDSSSRAVVNPYCIAIYELESKI
jgi:hypothetical protein